MAEEAFPIVRALHVGSGHLGGELESAASKALRNSDACIACLTRENMDAERIHFEAGAVELRDRKERLVLFGLDLNPSDLERTAGVKALHLKEEQFKAQIP